MSPPPNVAIRDLFTSMSPVALIRMAAGSFTTFTVTVPSELTIGVFGHLSDRTALNDLNARRTPR